MNTTDLFDFSFVDREYEKKVFEKFTMSSDKCILWIDGEHGVGKTTFLTHMLESIKSYKFAYFDIKSDKNSKEILEGFINEIQKFAMDDFCSFLVREYKAFYNNWGGLINNLSNFIPNNFSNIISGILDVSNYVINRAGEREESISVVLKYLNKILEKQKLFICIDNFSSCNKDTTDIFFDIFKPLLDNLNCKICIITTSNDMTDEKKIQIQETIPYTALNLMKFDKEVYFYQIMEPIFLMDNLSNDDIKYIYCKCDGKPQKLSVVISKLLDKHGIIYNTSINKAEINKDKLQCVLGNEYIHYNTNDFTAIQKWIIFSFLCLYDGVSIQIVKKLALYISKNISLYNCYTEKMFHKELINMIDHKQLISDGQTLNVYHESDYIDYMDIFSSSNMIPIFSKNAYEFILNCPQLMYREDLLCQHMRKANIVSWQERNYLYGAKLYNNHQYFDAQKIFSFLLNQEELLSDQQLLLIAMNQYESGKYKDTINIIEKINIDKLVKLTDKFRLFYFWGKSIYNYSGKINEAVDKLNKAKNFVNLQSEEYITVQNLLQMYYMEIPGKFSTALDIFNEIRINCKGLYPEIWASTMRGCHNFLNNNEEALELLNDAQNCTCDILEKQYIETTKGFVYARNGDFKKAKKCFENAFENIKKIKKHESSYVANNLAVCYMIEGKYSKAKEILLDAMFWNKTNYCKIVLNVHLMICECFLNHQSEAEKYLSFLEKYTNLYNPKDSILCRKIYLNIAVVSKWLGNDITFKSYIKKAKKYIENTSSQWRFYAILGQPKEPMPQNTYYSYAKFDPWFIVYAHD